MDTLVHVGLLNAMLATGLALLPAAARLLRRRPAIVHALWLLVLLKLITPPFLAIPISWLPRVEPTHPKDERTIDSAHRTSEHEEPFVNTELPAAQPNERPDEVGFSSVSTKSAETEPITTSTIAEFDPESSSTSATNGGISWEFIAAAIWLSGSAAWWILAAYRLCRFRFLLRSAAPAPAELQQRAMQLSKRLGLSRCPSVYVVPAPVTPLLWAMAGAPCLLIPAVLWARLTAEQQDTLLAHELAHLRRRDQWIRRLEIVVLGLYWWHPVVWWARHEIQEAEEQCCDAWVLWTLPAAAEAYASALLETTAYLSRLRPVVPLGASGAGQTQLLRRRLTMILQGNTPRSLSWTGVAVLIACSAVCLPARPTWGQAPSRTSADEETPALAQVAAPSGGTTAQPGTTPPAKITTGVGVNSDMGLTGTISIPRDVEEAKDAVELLQAQLEGKKAELLEARAMVEQAQRQVNRQERLVKQGSISAEEIEQSRTELTVRQARFRVKETQIAESEIRLRQAKRWLARLQSGSHSSSTGSNSVLQPSPGTSSLGTTPAPPYKGPAGGASASTLPAAKSQPDTSAAPTGSASNRLGGGGKGGRKIEGADSPGDSEQRIRNLEKKLDRLMEQMEELRREIRRQRSGGEGGSAPADPNFKPADPARNRQ
jgi:beta-lactamase regulating signal transducer with metallopeptidase domain